ncbi:MAG: magnesium transporter CorA family protein, partial [Acidobacteriota bacterium]
TRYRPAIKPKDDFQPGTWVRVEQPSDDEIAVLTEKLKLDEEIVRDALDPHEVPRVESEGDSLYFITRLPDVSDEFNDFTTPMMFVLSKSHMATVSRDSLDRLWQPYIAANEIPTTQQTKLFLTMMEAIVTQYSQRVTSINRQMRSLTSSLETLRPKDLGTIVEHERKLNDYLDALIPTNTALEKLLSGRMLKLYEDDRDLVEDLSIDTEQLITRCKSLLRTITNVRDAYRALMDTRLNETIRLLTVITLALTIPTMIAGLYGMNVDLPGDENAHYMFWVIAGASLLSAAAVSYYFLKKRR